MATDINRVFLIGRLTQDPEARVTPSGANVGKFSLAVNRKYKVNDEMREEVSFFNCVVWGRLVDIVKQYTQKGKQVAVEGRLRQNRWQDQQSGQNRSTVEIVVENLQLLGGSRDGGTSSGDNFQNDSFYDNPSSSGSSVDNGGDIMDEDIPF